MILMLASMHEVLLLYAVSKTTAGLHVHVRTVWERCLSFFTMAGIYCCTYELVGPG